VLFHASLPLLLASRGAPPPDTTGTARTPESGAAIGDLRFGLRARWLGAARASTRLGAGLELSAPTGKTSAYAGDGGFGYRGHLALSAGGARSALSAELGYAGRESMRLPSVLPTRVGPALDAGLGVRFALDPRAALWLGSEISARFGMGDGARPFDPRSTLVHVLLTARYRPFRGLPLDLGAGFGPSLGQAPGSADYRVLAFVAYAPDAPAPPPDQDGDGVPDASDVCLRLAGTPSNDPLMHGCPPEPLDTDGDSVPDGFDACPRVPGEATAERRTHGCPRSEPPSSAPAAAPAASLRAQEIVISEQVRFETNTAVLRSESDAILGAVAQVLAEHPQIQLLEVQGHTDATGTPELNRRLSQERAAAVVAWLTAHGVDPRRLRARGYGRERPIADNATEAGRASNRRVEFRVLDDSATREGAP